MPIIDTNQQHVSLETNRHTLSEYLEVCEGLVSRVLVSVKITKGFLLLQIYFEALVFNPILKRTPQYARVVRLIAFAN